MIKYKVVYFSSFFAGDKENKWNTYEARYWIDAYIFWRMIKEDFPNCYIQKQ